MPKVMSDNDVLGQFARLMDIIQAPPWDEVWEAMECEVLTFDDVEMPEDAQDATIWQACQDNDVVLITGNRNAEDPSSLEVTIRERNLPSHLPVLTLANADRVLRDQNYAGKTVERLLEILIDLDAYRGAGRLYLP